MKQKSTKRLKRVQLFLYISAANQLCCAFIFNKETHFVVGFIEQAAEAITSSTWLSWRAPLRFIHFTQVPNLFWDGEFTWPAIKGWKGDLQLRDQVGSRIESPGVWSFARLLGEKTWGMTKGWRWLRIFVDFLDLIQAIPAIWWGEMFNEEPRVNGTLFVCVSWLSSWQWSQR